IIHAIHESPLDFIPGFSVLQKIPEVPIWLSLTVILVSMAGAIVASLLLPPKDSAQVEGGGDRSPGSHHPERRAAGASERSTRWTRTSIRPARTVRRSAGSTASARSAGRCRRARVPRIPPCAAGAAGPEDG